MSKNKIEGIRFYPGDEVKFRLRDKCGGESVEDYAKEAKELWGFAFGNLKHPKDPQNQSFRVAKMKLAKEFDGNIGVRILYGKKISHWITADYLDKV